MVFKKWAAIALFGAAIAGPIAPGLALAQNSSSRALVITSPAAGASVPDPVTVSIGLAAAATGTVEPGGGMSGNHHHGQAYLIIDSPLPAAGTVITADAKHIVFPPGQRSLNVSLPAGQHHLQIVAANPQGEVTARVRPSAAMTITVQ